MQGIPEDATHHDAYAAFRHGPYRLYVVSLILAVLASSSFVTAVIWEVHRLSSSPLMLGLTAGVMAAPVILLSIFAGHVADRFNRKRVLSLTQIFLVLCPAILGITTLAGVGSIVLLLAMVGLNALVLTFARPARQSLIPTLVPKAVYPNAVTWNSSLFETSSVVGPLLAGLVIAWHGAGVSMVLSAISMAGCALITLFLPNPGNQGTREPMSWSNLLAGFRFVWKTKLMLGAMSMDAFAVLLGGATFLLPIFAERLGAGAFGYALLKASPAVGSISMAIVQAHRPPLRRAGRAILLAVAGYGVATAAFGMVPWVDERTMIFDGTTLLGFSVWFWLAAVMLLLTGVFDNISVVVRHSLVQLLTPDAMRGRVAAVNQVAIGASNELGGLESGITAQLFGPVASVVSGGVGAVLIVGVVAKKFPDLRKLGRLSDVSLDPVKLDERGHAMG